MTNPTPTDVNTLIERLQDVSGFIQKEFGRVEASACLATETIDALRAMQARVGALEEALGSFIPTNMSLSRPDVIPDETIVPPDVSMGELRRARSTQQEAQRHGE